MPSGVRADRHDVGVLVLGAEQLEAEALDRLARGAAEHRMALEHRRQRLVLDHAERHVERPDERDGRRERAVGRVLALALQGPLPVEVVVARPAPARVGGDLERALRDRGEREAGRRHERLLRAGHDHVDAPLVGREVDHAEAGDRVEDAHGAVLGGDLGQRADVVQDAGRRLGLGREERLHLSPALGQRPLDLGRIDLLAPLELEVDRLGAVGVAQLGPALPELPAGGDHARRRRARSGSRRPTRARPCRMRRTISTSFCVWNTIFRRSSTRA